MQIPEAAPAMSIAILRGQQLDGAENQYPSSMNRKVDSKFVRQLPKVELHAHLSGSVSKQTLHKIWQRKRHHGACEDLEDPLIALQSMPNIYTFFGIFNSYIYKLLDDVVSIREAVLAVVDDFEQDGVVYLELRTTPRSIIAGNIDRRTYVRTVLAALEERVNLSATDSSIEVHLILSVDRTMTVAEAEEVLDLAIAFGPGSQHHIARQQRQGQSSPLVLGLDLCGNPMKGDVSTFSEIFIRAKDAGLRTTVHCAEVERSSTDAELYAILSWKPHRLGHVINVSSKVKEKIKDQGPALELCLSCNMITGMVKGTYAEHHLGQWLKEKNYLALSTDDVGVFESPLSNEYLLAAEHFKLARKDLIDLSRRANQAAFAGHARTDRYLDEYEISLQQG